MKYLSIDLETTGLDPKTDQVLEFACVIGDTMDLDKNVVDMPFFQRVCIPRDGRVSGHVKALVMNAGLLSKISNGGGGNVCIADRLPEEFYSWLVAQGFETDKGKQVNYGGQHILNPFKSFTAAGKNFGGFDRPFIEHQWPDFLRIIPFKHRVLDPGSMWVAASDGEPPNLELCKERAGIKGSVTHNALDDARDVTACVQIYFKRQHALLADAREWHVAGRDALEQIEALSRDMQCSPTRVKEITLTLRAACKELGPATRNNLTRTLCHEISRWIDRVGLP